MLETNSEQLDYKDPCPNIHSLFSLYNHLYFGGKLGACSVEWSTKRMTLCAGVCSYAPGGGCVIKLSEPLLKLRPTKDLKETLLHEMIHAYNFLMKIRDNDKSGHGDKFKEKMNYINSANFPDPERPPSGYEVTIFHTFHDEVESYREHWWKCDKCHRVVKRAMNRPPQNADCPYKRPEKDSFCGCIHHQHVRNCGGNFLKIKEPKGYGKKQVEQANKRQKLITEYSPPTEKAPLERDARPLAKGVGSQLQFPGEPRYLGEEPKAYFPGGPVPLSTCSDALGMQGTSARESIETKHANQNFSGTPASFECGSLCNSGTKRKAEETEVVDLLEDEQCTDDQCDCGHWKECHQGSKSESRIATHLEIGKKKKRRCTLPDDAEVIDLTDVVDL